MPANAGGRRPNGQFPYQINFQVDAKTQVDLRVAARIGRISRAAVIRACLAKSLDSVVEALRDERAAAKAARTPRRSGRTYSP